jgi:hypothetical protein
MLNAEVKKTFVGDIFITYKDGSKYVHAISANDIPVRVAKLTHDQDAELRPALLNGKPYPVRHAAERTLAHIEFLDVAYKGSGRRGATDEAAGILKQLVSDAEGLL